MMTRLDDLVHNYHMVRAHQALAINDLRAIKQSEEEITQVLRLFGKSDKIKSFLVGDLFKRGEETIKKLAENDYH